MSSSTPTPTRTKRAGRKKLANPWYQPSDEHTPVAVQDLSQKLDVLLHVVTDLSTWVAGYEGRQDQGEASVTASPPTSLALHESRTPPIL